MAEYSSEPGGWNETSAFILRRGLQALQLPPLSAVQEQQFALYADFLLEYNRKVNLTAIVEPRQIAVKHFLDSLTVQKVLPLTPGLKLIDIGTGAGFPGVPLLILQPELKLTLLDSLAKRLVFLEQLLERLELRAELVHHRAEDAARLSAHRDVYDVATARAVAALPVLLEYAVPFLRIGGCFIAQKGPGASEEVAQSREAFKLLGASCVRLEALQLHNDNNEAEQRSLLVIRKDKATAKLYPRSPKQMKDNPLG